MHPVFRVGVPLLCLCGGVACSGDGGGEEASTEGAPEDELTPGEPASPFGPAADPDDPSWQPGVAFASVNGAGARGWVDLRGLVHEHSPHSHDACDNDPIDEEGNFDAVCMADFREGLCRSRHDFVMLTDHPTHFEEVEFPEALLFDPELGDVLVERGGAPVANRASCPDGTSPLVLAGTESSAVMPVALEAHPDDRGAYRELTDETAAALRDRGAVLLLAHTEGYDGQQLAELPIDGFEMFNLHATLELALGGSALATLLPLLSGTDDLHPDLLMVTILDEDPSYLVAWGNALSRGVRRVTTMGTDAHRNTFDFTMSDGERLDSYRRMNMWFSNHLLVEAEADGSWDDLALKRALAAGRLYGAFEVFGYPVDFDFHARDAGAEVEMGSAVPLSEALRLHVRMPRVRGLEDADQPPRLARVLRATEEGWEEMASGDGDLHYAPTEPGAYRAEIRLTPSHLRDHLGSFSERADQDHPWIYGNPIYVEASE